MDLNYVPHRRETISIVIYSPSFIVDLYWLGKCQVYVCLTFNAHVKLFFKKKKKKCVCSGAYLKFLKLSQEKTTDFYFFLSQFYFTNPVY